MVMTGDVRLRLLDGKTPRVRRRLEQDAFFFFSRVAFVLRVVISFDGFMALRKLLFS